jgi:hypothetical protein
VVERQAKKQGAEWIWLPLQGASPPPPEDFARILAYIAPHLTHTHHLTRTRSSS